MYYKCIRYKNDFWLLCTDFSHVESLSLIYRDIIHKLWDFKYLFYKTVIKKNYILSKNENLLKLAHKKLMIPQGCSKNFAKWTTIMFVGLYTYSVICNSCKWISVFNLLACFTLLLDLMTTADCEWKIKTLNLDKINIKWK